MYTLYQAWVARKAASELHRQLVPRVAELFQNATQQHDQITVLQNVALQQGQALNFFVDQLGEVLQQNAQLAQGLMPLQGFAEFVRVTLRQFFQEGTKTATLAGETARSLNRWTAEVQGFREATVQNDGARGQQVERVMAENVHVKREVERLGQRATETQHQLGLVEERETEIKAQLEKLRASFSAFMAARVPQIERVEKLAAQTSELLGMCQSRLEGLEHEVPSLQVDIDEIWGRVAPPHDPITPSTTAAVCPSVTGGNEAATSSPPVGEVSSAAGRAMGPYPMDARAKGVQQPSPLMQRTEETFFFK